MAKANHSTSRRAKIDTAVDPKPIISLMFAISVGFWASQLATYITPTGECSRLRSNAEGLHMCIYNKLSVKFVQKLAPGAIDEENEGKSDTNTMTPKDNSGQQGKNNTPSKANAGTSAKQKQDQNNITPKNAADKSGELNKKENNTNPNEIADKKSGETKQGKSNNDQKAAAGKSGEKQQWYSGIIRMLREHVKQFEDEGIPSPNDVQQMCIKIDNELGPLKKTSTRNAKKLLKKITRMLEKYEKGFKPINRKWGRRLTLVSGILFLLDLLCIVWWYARYIYRVQPRAEFRTYFLDFIICSMFALAANSWTKPQAFMFATLCGSGFLILRFVLLYFGSSASQTDRYILKIAGFALLLAVPISAGCLLGIDKFLQSRNKEICICGPSLPGVLSLIGIVLTICLKTKIDVAVAIYSARFAPIAPAYLAWPDSKLEQKKAEEQQKEVDSQHARIRHRVKTGLEDFNNLFHQYRKHDRIYSRVHSATELRVQSYILALPSCEEEDYAPEIENKAFMVAVSHWLDDLVDGRNELFVYRQLQKYKNLHHDPPLTDGTEHAKKLFTQIYRPLVVRYTDRDFYDRLYDRICECCSLPFNRKYMLLGLNRVAYGAVVFSPRLTHTQRRRILADHNDFLKVWNVEEKGMFENKVEKIINKISVGDEAGPILMGLTTKTVQEIALSSEKPEFNIGLSILLSILYAPLIYYHDIMQELDNDEMIPLQALDTDSDLWVPWLWEVCEILNEFKDKDERHTMRIKQIEMAYSCFKPMLPEHTKSELDKIYLKFPWNSKSKEHKTTNKE